MTEETALAVPQKVENVFLAARNSQEMANSQKELADWLKQKLSSCERSATELRHAVDHAKKMKWQHKQILSAFSREMQRVLYYEKLLKAVEAGFVLVPFTWMDVFAVRVKRDTPRGFAEGSDFQKAINRLPDVKSENLPSGSGHYVSELPLGQASAHRELKDGKEIVSYSSWSTNFQDVEFPLAAAKPELMNATAQAMALKIFDEIGVSPNRRGTDPVLLGTVKGPAYKKQFFLIAWYLDTRAL